MKNIKYKRRRRSKIGLRILQITCGITFFLPFGWIGITEQGGSLAWTWAALGSMVLSAILLLICNRIEQKNCLYPWHRSTSNNHYSHPYYRV